MEPSAHFMTTQPSFTSPFTALKEGISIPVARSEDWTSAASTKDLECKYRKQLPLCRSVLRQIIASITFLFLNIRSVNVPWPSGGMTDGDYIHAFTKIVMPIAMEFAPELVMSECHLSTQLILCPYLSILRSFRRI